MREIRRVEIQAQAIRLGPVDPALELGGCQSVAIDLAAAEVRITGMEVEAVAAWNERVRLFQIGTQLDNAARLARIVAGDGKAAAEFSADFFKAADVIALPAMQ